MRAQNAISLRFGHELDHSIKLFVGDRAAIGAKRKLSDTVVVPFFFRLVLGQADAGQFWVRVNDSGDRIIINMAVFAGDTFHTGDPLVLGLVGQHRPSDYIADRVNAVDLGLKMFVDLDSLLFIELNPDFFSAKSFTKRFASD